MRDEEQFTSIKDTKARKEERENKGVCSSKPRVQVENEFDEDDMDGFVV